MFCSNCGTTLLDEARFCWKCGTSQTSAASRPATGDALAPSPSPSLSSDSPRIRFSRREIVMSLIVLAVAVVGIIWTLAEFIIHNPQRALDIISITSNVLAILGTLYLAYDLLGRQEGPLVWLTLLITCGLVGALVVGPLVLYVVMNISTRLALRIALVGVLLGAFTGTSIGIPTSVHKTRLFSPTGFWIGLVGGFAFGFLFYILLVPVSGVSKIFPGLLVGALLTPVGGIVGGFQQFIYSEQADSSSKPRFFSQQGAWTGFISGFIFWFAFGFFVYGLLGGVTLGVVLGLVDAAAGGVSRFIFWLVNNLPNRVLGAIGLVLILIASFLQFASPLIELLNITGK